METIVQNTWQKSKLIIKGLIIGALALLLVLLYSYIFTILQLQDYALLLGSIGLFLTLAIVMYYSRKVQW